MGQIADDMINGCCCALCGQYFQKAHGFPVACIECWEIDCEYQIAIFKLIDSPNDKKQ